MVPRENKDNAYAKFGGEKQRVLWYFPNWPIQEREEDNHGVKGACFELITEELKER